MGLFRELIDKDNKVCPKAFCGIIGYLTLCGVAIFNRDTVSIGALLTVTLGALGLNSVDLKNKPNG